MTSTIGVTNIDLCTVLVPAYAADLPIDPSTGTESPAGSICTDSGATYNSGYTVKSATGNRVTVSAPSAELSVPMSITR